MSYQHGMSDAYIEYCARMRGDTTMGLAYRCDKCGELRDGYGEQVQSWSAGEPAWTAEVLLVTLCPDCAAPFQATLQAIAATKPAA